MIYKGNDKPMAPGVAISLKRLAWRHRKKLCITFMLVIAENVAFLLYPVLAGMAINAILGGQTSHAALYGLMVLFMWCMVPPDVVSIRERLHVSTQVLL